MLKRTLVIGASLALVSIAGCKKDNKAPQKGAATPAPAAARPAPAAGPTGATGAATPPAAPTAPTGAAKPPAVAPTAPAAAPTAPPAAPTPGTAPAAPAAAPAKPAPAAAPADPSKPTVPDAKAAAAKAREDLEARRKRIHEIYALGRSKEAKDAAALKDIITGSAPVYERASAIRALGREKRADVIPDLKTLVQDKATAIRIEAAIKLYQWGEQKFAMPVLTKLRDEGVALRRAFQTGYSQGKATYDDNAAKFFKDALGSDKVYVRLDAAVGLIELGKEGEGLPVVQKVLETEEKYHIRMAAVNYLTPLKTQEKVQALLELAAKDKDERVAKRAKDVLARARTQPVPRGVPAPATPAGKPAVPAPAPAGTPAAPAPAPAGKPAAPAPTPAAPEK